MHFSKSRYFFFLASLDSQISVFVHSRKLSRFVTFYPNFSWVQIQSLLFTSNLICWKKYGLSLLLQSPLFLFCVFSTAVSFFFFIYYMCSSIFSALDMFFSMIASLYFFFFFKFGCTGPTTLDILIQRPRDLRDMGIGEILQGVGALSVKDILYIQLYMN